MSAHNQASDFTTNEDETSDGDFGPLSDDSKVLFDESKLSPEKPYIFIEKATLIQDINERLEESAFFIYKDYIENYPEDNIMLVLDNNEKYGEPFYVCLTKEAKDLASQELGISDHTEPDEQSFDVVERSQSLLEVISRSTEEEILDEQFQDTRPKIEIVVLLDKEGTDRSLQLSNKWPSDHAELYLEILPESQFYDEEKEETMEALEPINRKVVHCGVQISTEHTTGVSQTAKPKLCNACSQTELKLFTENEKDKLWCSSDMESFLLTAEKRLVDVLVENASGGLEKPWTRLKDQESEIESAKNAPLSVSKSFSCVGEKESKMITSIDWHPLLKDLFVVSTTQNCSFEEHTDRLSELLLSPCLLYIWSYQDQLLPKILLASCDEIFIVKFNPSMPHLVSGGAMNGQLVLWDLSDNEDCLKSKSEYEWGKNTTLGGLSEDTGFVKSPVARYCASSNIDSGHLLGIQHLTWLPAEIEVEAKGEVKYVTSDLSHQIATCGLDGCLRFWDIRFQLENPGGTDTKQESVLQNSYNGLDSIWKPFHVVDLIPPDGQKHLSLSTFSLKLEHSNQMGW